MTWIPEWRRFSIYALQWKTMVIGWSKKAKPHALRATFWRPPLSRRMRRFGLRWKEKGEMHKNSDAESEADQQWGEWMPQLQILRRCWKKRKRLKFKDWWRWWRMRCSPSSTTTQIWPPRKSEFWEGWEKWLKWRRMEMRSFKQRSSHQRRWSETGRSGSHQWEARWSPWPLRRQPWRSCQRMKSKRWRRRQKRRVRSWRSYLPNWCSLWNLPQTTKKGKRKPGGLFAETMRRRKRGRKTTQVVQMPHLWGCWHGLHPAWSGPDASWMSELLSSTRRWNRSRMRTFFWSSHPTSWRRWSFWDPDTLYLPLKAVYGFRRSPKLWGLHRDKTIKTFDIKVVIDGRCESLELKPMESEQNLWKVVVVRGGF